MANDNNKILFAVGLLLLLLVLFGNPSSKSKFVKPTTYEISSAMEYNADTDTFYFSPTLMSPDSASVFAVSNDVCSKVTCNGQCMNCYHNNQYVASCCIGATHMNGCESKCIKPRSK